MQDEYKKFNLYKAIRNKCMDCTCNQPVEIRECTVTSCALFPYRFGSRSSTIIGGSIDD